MTYKTDQMSVRPCGIDIFKTLKLPDCWADVDENWHMGCATKLLEDRILNSGSCAPDI